MTKKEIIVIIGTIILFVIILFAINKNKIKKKSEENILQNSVRTEYNEDEGKYVVYDEDGKEIYDGTEKSEAEFYHKHPDFDPGFETLDQNYLPSDMNIV